MTFAPALAPLSIPAEGPFDLITGLPVHPLVVHFAVVLLPLAALGLIVLVLVPKWRGTFGWLVMAGLFVGTGASYVAKESGEALAQRVGTPQQHASVGDVLPLVAGVLFLVALVWFLLDRKDRRNGQRSGPLVMVLGIVGIVLAAAATILTVIVGHTGAEAAWSGKIAATESGSGSAGTSSAAPGGSDGTLSAATVAAHATPADCWSIVNGNVYDLTEWIPQHPGGAGVVEAMCGTDGTSSYEGQHGGQGTPQRVLDGFLVGAVGAPDPTAGTASGTSASTAASTSSAAAAGITRKDVTKHASTDDCWSIVNGDVYDLTQWIPQHPGGAGVIEAMCGTDGTAAYESQHAGQGRTQDILDGFLVGPLATPAAAGTVHLDVTLASYRTALPAKAFTRKQVARHHAPGDCWSIVSRKVYNLTTWIPRHPGGAGVIIAMCGRDGTALFTSQHGGQGGPAAILAQFQIGTLR